MLRTSFIPDRFYRPCSGFTLIELSIVLIIISLIVGGIIGGKALIISSRIHATIQDIQSYRTAINTFNLQFDSLPGDFREANDYWSIATSGDGNGFIHEDERLDAWEHLALARIIPGNFDPATGNFLVGTTVPKGAFDDTGYEIFYNNNGSIHNLHGHNIQLERNARDTGRLGLDGGILTAAQAYQIDIKMDDGKANLGKVATLNGMTETGCLSGVNYIKSGNVHTCRMFFFIDNK